MATKRQPKLSVPAPSRAAAALAGEAGAAPKAIHDVSKLSDGRLKLVGVPHDTRVGMVVPERLANAWAQAARERGITKTDLFEEMLFDYLKRHGWTVGA